MRRLPSGVLTAVEVLGLALVFVGERLLSTGTPRAVASLLGVGLVLLALAARAWRAFGVGAAAQARVERALLGAMALGLLALLVYFLTSDVFAKLLGQPLPKEAPRLSGVLQALCPMLLLAGVAPLVLGELAYASMARAPHVEWGRVRDALLSGLGLAAVLVFAFAAYYVADERDVKADLAYFRAARPGSATVRIAGGLTAPVDVALFFPPHNDVGEAVADYFRDLAERTPELRLHLYDQALDVAAAREAQVTANGTIVLSRGQKREPLFLGVDLERARSDLRTLDAQVQKRLLSVSRQKKTLYFTTGHGERTEAHAGAYDQRGTVRQLRQLLRDQNEEVKDLSAAEGLAVDVPRDAGALVVLGPTAEFLPEELAALKRYQAQGGRLLLALDPEAGLAFQSLTAPWSVEFVPTPLCNDQVYIARRYEHSDRVNLAVSTFSAHPSVTTLREYVKRLGGVIFVDAGPVNPLPGKPARVSVQTAVSALPSTWLDVNGNFELDAALETRKAWPLVAAVTVPEGKREARAVIVGDSDAFTDGLLASPGNAYFALDLVKWLLDEEATAGTTDNETDAPVEHTHSEDLVWFYGTVFLVPAAVLAVGVLVSRRARRKRT